MAVCTCSVSAAMAFHTKSGIKFEVHNHSLNLTGVQMDVIYRQLQLIMILYFVSITIAHLVQINYRIKRIYHLWPSTFSKLSKYTLIIKLYSIYPTIQINNNIFSNQDTNLHISKITLVLAVRCVKMVPYLKPVTLFKSHK
jgi:hypothetical protein